MSADNNHKSFYTMENIEFDLFRNPSKADGNETDKSFHVRINNSQTVDLKELINRIHQSCSMTPSDVYGVLTALKDEISYALAHGQMVNLDGLCRFRLILGSTESGRCSGKENGKDIGFKKIRITPCKELNEETRNKLVPLMRKGGNHSSGITDDDITKALSDYFEKNLTITRKKLEEICNITRYRATLYIKNMVERGIMKNIGYRTHPIYALNSEKK